MEALKILSRKEMREINGGYISEGGCINCITPGGEECWYRSNPSNPQGICEGIYPGYDDGVVGSLNGDCTGCNM